jgi:hypothetical protein
MSALPVHVIDEAAQHAVRDIEHEWNVSLHAVFSNQLA